MQTLQPTLRLGRDVWDRTAMPVEEFVGRASRLRDQMRRAGLDALILYGRGMNGCGHPTWLSNYIVKLPFSALVVLPLEGEPALMFEGATRGRSAAQATTWIEDVRPCWNMAETCHAVLSDRGLTGARIGLAGAPRLMPHQDWTLLRRLVGGTFVDAEALVWEERVRKSARELAQVTRAGRIVRESLRALEAGDRTFAGEDEMAAFVMREARMRGAEDIRVMIARPEEPVAAFRPPVSTPLPDGPLVTLYLACSWERYWFAAIRTCVVERGRPAPAWTTGHEERFRQLVASARPGEAIGEWARAATMASPPAAHSWLAAVGIAYGVGITPEEAPVLAAETDARFERGMCLAMCTAALDERERLVLHGDTIQIE